MNTEPNTNTTNEEPATVPYLHAGFWLRFFAMLIDIATIHVCQIVFTLLSSVQIYKSTAILDGTTSITLLLSTILLSFAISSLFYLVYFIGFELSPLRATPGKFIMGIYVCQQDGQHAEPIKTLLRNFSRILCCLTLGLGFVMAGFTSQKQGLHDMIASTYVMRMNTVVPQQRILGILFSLLFFILVFLILPTGLSLAPAKSASLTTVETVSQQGSEWNRNDAGEIPLDGRLIDFPSNSIGYLQHEFGKISFTSAYVRTEKVERTSLDSQKLFSEKLYRITTAYFQKALTEADIPKLKRASDFFDDARRVINQEAVFTIELTYPSYLQVCHPDRILSSRLDFNPEFVPQLEKNIDESLRMEISPLTLFEQNKFYVECSGLIPNSNLEIALQNLVHPSTNVPPLFINVRANEKMRSRTIASINFYQGGQDSFALWNKDERVVTVGIFASKLDREEKKRMYRSGSIQAGSTSPEVIITFQLGETGRMFMRDQTQSYTVTFFRQESGPLAFPGNASEVSVTYHASDEQLPALLTGKVRTGERLTGKVLGQKIIKDENGEPYPLEWNIPFNALLAILN